MVKRRSKTIVYWLSMGLLLFVPPKAFSDPLPPSTQAILKELNFDPSILDGIDKELQVPEAWIEKAKEEGTLKIRSLPLSPKEIKLFYAPFKERYPFINLDYFGSNTRTRVIKTLEAYRSGRILADVITNMGVGLGHYIGANALEDLRTIPAVKQWPQHAKDPDGLWVGISVNYWCMGYNTKLVKREDLPKRWEDLLSNPRWRGGNLALTNRPVQWLPMLWRARGNKWLKSYLKRPFTEVRPQLRKEGMGAANELLAAGEFDALIPASMTRVHAKAVEGAPISLACPDPIPVKVTEAVLLKGADHPNAARLFINWRLSKEGQVTAYRVRNNIPAHEGLERRKFVGFADEILGKKQVYREPGPNYEVKLELAELWNNLWLRRGRK